MTMLDSTLDRREFFKRTTLLAGVALIPAKLIGCGTDEDGVGPGRSYGQRGARGIGVTQGG